MALTAQLVESTPYRLRYLLTNDGVDSSPSDPDVDGSVTIPNDAGVTPDLRTDASPGHLDRIINVRLNGYGPLPAGAITQAQARALLASQDAAGAVLTNDLVGRAVCEVQGRTGRLTWAVDVDVDVQGDPVVIVRSSVGVAGTGYLDIHFRHTYDL
jgi:hypothetical protein